jgi:sporulation protein YlmC with PRC-barrel domain
MTTVEFGMVALGDSDLALAAEEDDVRGMRVLDPNGHRVGEVREIVVDEEQRRARLLVVGSGGILGLGECRRLVPVDDVERVGDDVRLRATHDEVRGSSPYDPALADAPDYAGVYGYFGYTPFWLGGYPVPYFHQRD